MEPIVPPTSLVSRQLAGIRLVDSLVGSFTTTEARPLGRSIFTKIGQKMAYLDSWPIFFFFFREKKTTKKWGKKYTKYFFVCLFFLAYFGSINRPLA